MKKLQRASVKTPFFALSLLVGFLFLLSPGSAAAQSAIPPFDGPTPIRSDVTALGELCANTDGAIKERGMPVERSDDTPDTCLANTDTHIIFCRYDSSNGTYHAANYCRVTYKEIAGENNSRIFDISGLGTVRTATTTEDIADHSTADQNPTIPAATCSFARLDVCVVNLPGQIFALLAFLMLMISSIILGIAGTVFNWVIIRTVFQFGTYFGTSESMLVTWGVIRDIGNIALLFGFIFVGVATILNTHSVEGFTAKKALPRLIIFAVLLNFSLFASQGVIDVANGFSSVFATLSGNECSQTTSNGSADQAGTQTFEDCANLGISSKVLEAVGMHKVFPSSWGDVTSFGANLWNQPYSYTVLLLLSSLFVTITAMVLLAGAIMLIIRVVSLTLLMVTSPIGFAGMAIPPLQGLAKDWWHRLISQSFFAPVYLLMIFISLKLVENLQSEQTSIVDALLGNTAGGPAGAAVGTGTVAGNMQVIMIFGIVIGFMIAALIVAQKMGAYGAKFATQNAAAMTLGAHGFVARRTAGRAMNHFATRVASSQKFADRFGVGNQRMVSNLLAKGGSASMSPRSLLNNVTKVAGVDLGKPNKAAAHGFHGIEEKLVKDRADLAKRVKPTKTDIGQAEEFEAELKERDKEIKQRLAPRLREIEEQRVKVAEARLKGDKAALEQERRIFKEKVALHEKELEDLTGDKTDTGKEYKALKAQAKEWRKRGEKAAQDRYVENIEHSAHAGGPLMNVMTLGPLADHHAADEIVKNANKSKLDKALDDFKKAAGSGKDDEDDHSGDHGGGGGDHGGGGGGHKPAAGGGHGGGDHH